MAKIWHKSIYQETHPTDIPMVLIKMQSTHAQGHCYLLFGPSRGEPQQWCWGFDLENLIIVQIKIWGVLYCVCTCEFVDIQEFSNLFCIFNGAKYFLVAVLTTSVCQGYGLHFLLQMVREWNVPEIRAPFCFLWEGLCLPWRVLETHQGSLSSVH